MSKKIQQKDLELIETSQSIYDGFNEFIMSSDLKVFGKFLARSSLMQKVRNVPGDIVECGVFKGSGIFTFLKLKRHLFPNSSKKVIGFDFFNSAELVDKLNGSDKENMNALFENRQFSHKQEFEKFLNQKIIQSGFTESEFELIPGDVCQTSRRYADERPGAKISLLYMDLDLEVPTYETLKNLWPLVTKGGIVVFDEYGYHKWSESRGVDRFLEEVNVKLQSLDYSCPTACIVKE